MKFHPTRALLVAFTILTSQSLAALVSEGEHPFRVQVTPPPAFYVGDTAHIQVTISWAGSTEEHWLVRPTSSAQAKGLRQVALHTAQERGSDSLGQASTAIVFSFGVMADGPGEWELPEIRFEARSRDTTHELRAAVGTLHCRKRPNAFWWLLLPIALAALTLGWWIHRKSALSRTTLRALEEEGEALASELKILEQRVAVADSQEWLLALENLCVRQQSWAARSPEGKLADPAHWAALQEEFRHARYGGGKRDVHQNRETLKRARALMGYISP